MFDLKVNFHKSLIIRMNIAHSWLMAASHILHCRIGQTPYKYLGLPIGGNSRKLSFFESSY
jgi:hypothetical protein